MSIVPAIMAIYANHQCKDCKHERKNHRDKPVARRAIFDACSVRGCDCDHFEDPRL